MCQDQQVANKVAALPHKGFASHLILYAVMTTACDNGNPCE
jgi:hypothetical protein